MRTREELMDELIKAYQILSSVTEEIFYTSENFEDAEIIHDIMRRLSNETKRLRKKGVINARH